MKNAESILSLFVIVLLVSACVTTDSSQGKPKYAAVDVATAKNLHDRGVTVYRCAQ